MKKKLFGCAVTSMFFVSLLLPLSIIAEDPENPEIADRQFDVKLFGMFPGVPQPLVKHIDIISAWFDEDSENPDYLTICLKTRSLVEKTEIFEALYKVNWYFNQARYGVIIKIHTDGMFLGFLAYKDLGNDRYENHFCEGTFDVQGSVITWVIPKELIGDPNPGGILTSTSACALLRPWDEATYSPGADFFKDLTGYGENYQIKY